MAGIESFRDLLVWQKAMDLAVQTCRMAGQLPRAEQGVLGFQLRKSAISIPSNIAEGKSRHSTASYIQHLWIAHASASELETQIEIASRLGVLASEQADLMIRDSQEIGRMLNGLVRSLRRSSGRDQPSQS